MKQFEANRLSTGNRVFPAKIIIDDHGVTLKVPGLFGGKERSFSYRDITSINLDTPMIGFSTVIIRTLSRETIHAEGFSKADAKEIKEMVMMGIANPTSIGSGYSQNQAYSAPSQPPIETADQILAKAEAKRIEHEIDTEKRKQEQEEIKQYFEAAKKYWKIWTPLLAVLIIWMVYTNYQKEDTSQSSAELNIKLEQIEDKVKDAIDNGDKTLALELANQLVHPSKDRYAEKSKLLKDVTYAEYWLIKRESYKDQIRNIGKTTTQPKKAVNNVASEKPLQNTVINEDVSPPAESVIDGFSGIIVTEKAYFHTDADVNTIRKAYVVNGQQVEVTKEKGDFYYAIYTADNGNQTKGWLLKNSIETTD